MGGRVTTLICLCENGVLVEKGQKPGANEVANNRNGKYSKNVTG